MTLFFRFLLDISEEIHTPVKENLAKANYFSVLVDGATDTATVEQELVYVRYLNSKAQQQNFFLSIEAVKSSDANGVLDSIMSGRFVM